MKNNNIYIRIIRKADLTVFNVEKNQKTYFDPISGRFFPYSSAQQIKRNVMEELCSFLDVEMSPYTCEYEKNKESKKTAKSKETAKEKEVTFGEHIAYSTTNPRDVDQLLGGYFKGGEVNRTSPFSFSAMIPLHKDLIAMKNNNNISINRNTSNNNVIRILDNKTYMSDEEVEKILSENPTKSFTQKFIAEKDMSSGIFVLDLVIDVERLFSVKIKKYSPEITTETYEQLISEGWFEKSGQLYPPKEVYEKWVKAVCVSLFNWRIRTNQSTHYSPLSILGVSISNNPQCATNQIFYDDEKIIVKKGEIIHDDFLNVPIKNKTFVTNDGKNLGLLEFEDESYTQSGMIDASKYLYNEINEYYKKIYNVVDDVKNQS